ncbi:MAG: caspase family protein [Leptolyngbyaceae cyanobacterium RU_5_1]|nr:caspase family protein [Leptolyngbyaceae cyanobacterium RU_5_1]
MARYALIIGIAEYAGSFRSLETPVQNANAIANLLDRHGHFDQVKRLPFRREAGQKDLGQVIRKPLTCLELTSEIQQFLHDADQSDVLIYYSGHGFTLTNPLSANVMAFWLPQTAR